MTEKRSPFESRDLTSSPIPSLDPKKSQVSFYSGRERRYKTRRQTKDRRADVRFDFDSSDRRENHGRRKEDGIALFRD